MRLNYSKIAIGCIALLAGTMTLPGSARADCDLGGGNGTRAEGVAVFNADYQVVQICQSDGTWKAAGKLGCPAGDGCVPDPCTGSQSSPVVGDICTDGSVYAGLSPDGNVPMYTTPADASGGAYWGTFNFATGSTSNVTGRGNTADVYAHVLAGDGTYNPDDGFTPNASVLCEELSVHGHSDWYLPARDELNVLYTNKNTGALNGTFDESGSFPAGWYWSSSEIDLGTVRIQRFSDGNQSNTAKWSSLPVRCVRKY